MGLKERMFLMMARAETQTVENVDIKVEMNLASKKKALNKNRPLVLRRIYNSFIWMGSNDYWSDGQWMRYWEERLKGFDAS